jgi:hypothetical protein
MGVVNSLRKGHVDQVNDTAAGTDGRMSDSAMAIAFGNGMGCEGKMSDRT